MSLAWKNVYSVSLQRRLHVQRARRARHSAAEHAVAGAQARCWGQHGDGAEAPERLRPDSGRSSRPRRRRAAAAAPKRGRNAAEVAAASRSSRSSGGADLGVRVRGGGDVSGRSAVRRRHRRAPALFSFPAREASPAEANACQTFARSRGATGIGAGAKTAADARSSARPRLLRRRPSRRRSLALLAELAATFRHGARNIARGHARRRALLAFASDKSWTSAVSISAAPLVHRRSVIAVLVRAGVATRGGFARELRVPLHFLLRVVPAQQVLERGERPALVATSAGVTSRDSVSTRTDARSAARRAASPGASVQGDERPQVFETSRARIEGPCLSLKTKTRQCSKAQNAQFSPQAASSASRRGLSPSVA